MKSLNKILTLSLPALVLMLSACQGDGDAAPVGSKVIIHPPAISFTATNLTPDDPATTEVESPACVDMYKEIIVNVNDPSGASLGKTDLFITLGGGSLYEDTNNNLILDSGDIEVTAAGQPGYVTETDHAGVKLLLLKYPVACTAYTSYLTVYASGGRLASTMELVVKQEFKEVVTPPS